MAEQRKKKLVRVESQKSAATGAQSVGGAREASSSEPEAASWVPTPEAKKQSTMFRLIAAALWLLAIVGEAIGIFVLLRQNPVNMVLLIVLIVVIGALAIGGSLLWKRANRLDPAAKSDTVRFFVQNQLGAIITVIAFLPLIILIFTNKNMDAKQKGIAGTIGIVVAAVAVFFGLSLNPPSVEQYTAESNIVSQLTGEDMVFWTKSGSVFHVCEAVPDVNKESKDGEILFGTVAEAHAAGKERLTLRWESEALNYCGYTQEQVDAVKTAAEPDATTEPETSETPAE